MSTLHITLVPTGVAPGSSYNAKHTVRLNPSVTLNKSTSPRLDRNSIYYPNIMLVRFRSSSHLLYVIVQRYDAQRGREVGAPWNGGANGCWLADEALVRWLLKIRRLVVLIQDFDDQVGKCRERVTVVLFSLFNFFSKKEIKEMYLLMIAVIKWFMNHNNCPK